MTGQHRPAKRPPLTTRRKTAIAGTLGLALLSATCGIANAYAPHATAPHTAAAPTAVERTREPTGHGGPIAPPTLADPHVWTPTDGPVIADGQRLPAATAAPVKTTPTFRPAPKPTSTPTVVAKAAPTPAATGLLALVNADRATAGCPPVTIAADLMQEAQDQADAQAVADSMYHSDGGTWLAENVAAGQDTAAEVEKSWMDSPGHRKNTLTCSYRLFGWGTAVSDMGNRYWTGQFA